VDRKSIVNKIKRFKLVSFLFRIISPGYSTCDCCGLPWKYCIPKSVPTSYGSATFATCQYCWDNSTLNELKIYYTDTYHMQKNSLYNTKYSMGHTLKQLLDSVEIEYNNEKLKRRKQKVLYIKRTLKKNRKKNVTLFRQN